MNLKTSVSLRIPATTANCGPGFDVFGIACTLYNDVTCTLLNPQESSRIEISGEGAGRLPTDRTNIAFQAFERLFSAAGVSTPAVVMHWHNRIPLSSGLGSSATAIVGGLAAANALLGHRYSKEELLQHATAMEGHPDNVAPAIFGGITVSIMTEQGAQSLMLPAPQSLRLVVAMPELELSTHLSRQVLPSSVPLSDAVFNLSRAAYWVAALCAGDLTALGYALDDRLHQPYRAPLIPGMEQVLQAARDAGAIGATLSGAGPCMMAYVTDNGEAIGRAMVRSFAMHDVPAKFAVLAVDSGGVSDNLP